MVYEVGYINNEGSGWGTEVWETLVQGSKCENRYSRLQAAHLRGPQTPLNSHVELSRPPPTMQPCSQSEFSKGRIGSDSSPALTSSMAPSCPQDKIHILDHDLTGLSVIICPCLSIFLPLSGLATLISWLFFKPSRCAFDWGALRSLLSPWERNPAFPSFPGSLLKYSFLKEFFPSDAIQQ